MASTTTLLGVMAMSGAPDATDAPDRLLHFSRFLFALGTAEVWYVHAMAPSGEHLAVAGAFTAVAAATWLRATRSWQCGAAAAAWLAHVALRFPYTANHEYLILICFALLALTGPSAEGARDVVAALRWLVALGFFWAGAQKILFGCYFHGEVLAAAASQTERFGLVLRPFLGSPLFPVLSNLCYALEIAVAVLLIARRTRVCGLWFGVGFLVVIEVAAREAFFGGLMIGLLLLFDSGRRDRLALVPLGLLYAYMVVAATGYAPLMELH